MWLHQSVNVKWPFWVKYLLHELKLHSNSVSLSVENKNSFQTAYYKTQFNITIVLLSLTLNLANQRETERKKVKKEKEGKCLGLTDQNILAYDIWMGKSCANFKMLTKITQVHLFKFLQFLSNR